MAKYVATRDLIAEKTKALEAELAALKEFQARRAAWLLGKLDVLVTVAMAYEGLDIPAVSHLICLTRIRSTPWIEQMTARANRIDRVTISRW